MLPLLLARAGQLGALVLMAVHVVQPEIERPLPDRVVAPAADDGVRTIDAFYESLERTRWNGLRLDTLFAQDLAVEPAEQPGDRVGTGTMRSGHWSAHGGIGFTADPTTFLLAFGADYFVNQNVSVGPLFQFGLDDDPFIFAPTLHVQWTFDLPDIQNLKPYIQAGLGFAYFYENGRRGDNDDLGFLFNPGVGADWYFNDNMAAGTSMLFNILPDEVFDEEFFFSWQVLTFRFIF